jgi:hypothetical protein
MDGRGLVGRRRAQLIFALAVGLDALAAFLFLAAPSGTGPMFDAPPAFPVRPILAAAGVALNVLGLVWMARIVRADPEAHRSWWRAARGR